MSQSGWLAVALVVAFVLYLAANQRLALYWRLLTGGGATTPAAGGSAASAAPSASAGASSPANDFTHQLEAEILSGFTFPGAF